MNGWRFIFTSLLVRMLTTAGIALRAASRTDAGWMATPSPAGVRAGAGSAGRPGSRSGRSVATTKKAARQMVAVWAKISQSLRIG